MGKCYLMEFMVRRISEPKIDVQHSMAVLIGKESSTSSFLVFSKWKCIGTESLSL